MPGQDKFLGWDKPGKALITGASAGIGLCFARQLAQKGFDLVLLARRGDRLQSLADKLETECAIRCEILSADLSEPDEIRKIADCINQMDNLDILINNAGFGTIGYFTEVPIEKTMRMFHLHMTACVLLTHAALQGMQKRKRGAIINLSSVAAFFLSPGNVMYNTTKNFIKTFSENIRLEVSDADIRIQALCPGFTHTEFHDVGDFENFDKSVIPRPLWMSADKVASVSLKALAKNRKVILIPGWKNRLFTWILQHNSIMRWMARNNVKKRSRP